MWRQDLGAWVRGAKGLEMEANLTYERTRQEVFNRSHEQLELTSRPARQMARILASERGPYDMSIEYTHTGRQEESVGLSHDEDVILEPLNAWDVRLNRQFGPDLRLFLDIDNVSAAPDRSYQGNPSRPRYYKADVREYRLGVKWGR